MATNLSEPLQQLRDIHLPTPISWWPPAPGWVALAALIILSIAFLIWRHKRAHNQLHYERLALKQLCELETIYQQNKLDATQTLCRLSTLMRQIALLYVPTREIAGLHGEQWLRALDKLFLTNIFSKGAGRVLLDGPYKAHSNTDLTPIFNDVKNWLKGKHHV